MNILQKIIIAALVILAGSALLSIPGSIIEGVEKHSLKEGFNYFKRASTSRIFILFYMFAIAALVIAAIIFLMAILGGNK